MWHQGPRPPVRTAVGHPTRPGSTSIVPDPAAVPIHFEPGVDYAWQNPLIRQTVFQLAGKRLPGSSWLDAEKRIDLGAGVRRSQSHRRRCPPT